MWICIHIHTHIHTHTHTHIYTPQERIFESSILPPKQRRKRGPAAQKDKIKDVLSESESAADKDKIKSVLSESESAFKKRTAAAAADKEKVKDEVSESEPTINPRELLLQVLSCAPAVMAVDVKEMNRVCMRVCVCMYVCIYCQST